MSWAAIAKSEPVVQKEYHTCTDPNATVAVVDANAVIQRNGLINLNQKADRIVTIPEVLTEIRDAESRQAVAALPFRIETIEPHEESMRAVVSFARATGDLHALSSVDMRLIALARTLEVEYYGDGHLRTRPAAPKVSKKSVVDSKVLPGWGAEGGDWTEIDRINEEEAAAAEAAIRGSSGCGVESRISREVQELSLDERLQSANDDAEDELDAGEDEIDDDDQWEVAHKNRNKARRVKRKEARKQAREEELEMEAAVEQAHGQDMSLDEDEEIALEHPAVTSAIFSMTADFAMQNVMLQMGLRLLAPDGKQITSVTSQVTKEVGRLFCPRCGNATLDRVQVTISPEGAEQYGVRKKHILRGTRYSLPRPRGGKNPDPILREDQLLTKKHLLRAKKAAAKAAELDPFAPEYTDETWHQVAAVSAGPASMATLLNSGWKKNPNERKHVATNRRRK
eukprot:jgi/Picsp_1/4410/NSC_01916-R1_nin one binding protein